MSTQPNQRRLVREPQRKHITGCPQSTWYKAMAEGTAPKPVKIGPQAVAWIEDELFEWVEQQIAVRDGAA